MSGKAAFEADKAKRTEERKERIQGEIDPLVFKLRDAGFNILPGVVNGKHPIGTKNKDGKWKWGQYQKEFISDEEFSRMCINDNTGLWCIITGEISGNLVVIDFDSVKTYETFFKEKFEDKTMAVKTPSGGVHLYFKCRNAKDMPKSCTGYNGFPIDIKAKGGAVVSPGSVNDDGEYVKINNLEPMIVDISDVLGCLPKKKTDQFSGITKFKRDMTAAGFDIHTIMENLGIEDFEEIEHGHYKCECMFKKHDTPHKEFEVYTQTDSFTCHGCRATGDIIDIVQQIRSCEFKDAVEYLEELTGVNSKILKFRDLQSEFDPEFVVDRFEWVKNTTFGERAKIIDDYHLVNDKGVFQTNNFSDWLMFKSGEHFITLEDANMNKGIMRYADGVFIPFGAPKIETIAEKLVQGFTHVQNYQRREFLGSVKANTYTDRNGIDADPDIINMVNGLYNIKTGELSDHTPDYPSFVKVTVKYDPDAKCPAIDKFIRELVPEDKVQMVYEIMGYSYRNEKLMKTAFIFHGKKNSGKSKLLDLIKMMIGPGVSAVSAQNVANTIFGAAEISDKLANIVGDLGNTTLVDTGMLKSIIYGELINVQRKGQMLYDIFPKCVLIYGTNSLPKTKSENEDAFKGRFQIIDFPNLFEGNPNDGGNDDKNILDKLTTDEELSGFFNKAMAAMKVVDEQGHFTNSETLDERVKKYDYTSDPTLRFFDNHCKFAGIGAQIAKDVLYQLYREWCEKNNLIPIGKGKFTISLQTSHGIQSKLIGSHGNQIPTYIGVDYVYEEETTVAMLEEEMEDW